MAAVAAQVVNSSAVSFEVGIYSLPGMRYLSNHTFISRVPDKNPNSNVGSLAFEFVGDSTALVMTSVADSWSMRIFTFDVVTGRETSHPSMVGYSSNQRLDIGYWQGILHSASKSVIFTDPTQLGFNSHGPVYSEILWQIVYSYIPPKVSKPSVDPYLVDADSMAVMENRVFVGNVFNPIVGVYSISN